MRASGFAPFAPISARASLASVMTCVYQPDLILARTLNLTRSHADTIVARWDNQKQICPFFQNYVRSSKYVSSLIMTATTTTTTAVATMLVVVVVVHDDQDRSSVPGTGVYRDVTLRHQPPEQNAGDGSVCRCAVLHLFPPHTNGRASTQSTAPVYERQERFSAIRASDIVTDSLYVILK